MKAAVKEGLEKKFKLTSSIAVSNLVCFDLEGRIRKYENVNDIMKDFFDLRKEYYQKRKEHLLGQLTFDLARVENRVRFVTEIITGSLIVQNRKRKDLLQDLKERKYFTIFKTQSGPTDDEDQAEASDHGYNYLLSMPIWNLTMEKVELLMKEKALMEAQVKTLIGQTPIDLWEADMVVFIEKWDTFESGLNELESQAPNNRTQAGGKKAIKNSLDTMLKKPKKKVVDSDDTMDSEEEFLEKKPAVKRAAVKKETVPKKAPAKAKAVAVKDESKDDETSAESISPKKAVPVKAAKKVAEKKVSGKQTTLNFNAAAREPTVPAKRDSPNSEDSQPKKRTLGGRKAVLPGKKATIVVASTKRPTVVVSDDDLVESEEAEESDQGSVESDLTMEASAPARSKRPAAKRVYASSSDGAFSQEDESFQVE